MSGEHAHPEVAALDAEVARLGDALARLTAQVVALEAGAAAMQEGLAAMATWHDYSGKPGGNLPVKAGSYVRLDVDVADPPRTGVAELHLMYANAALTWKTGETAGVIRVKYVREDGDETGFADFTVVRGATFEIGRASCRERVFVRV